MEGDDLARSNLLVVLCALPDWNRAESQVDVFLSFSLRYQITEAVDDLTALQRALSVDPHRLAAVLGRLQQALQRH
ncbi:hypothetical protein [Streptomyces sp. NPDC096132]|uniref:hypothetical protein n=1 Tax=Streptomyces sp. NPDC096132 TaxID=3366075 RepID=UPI00381D1CBF